MAGLTLEDIHKNFGSVVAAREVNLNLPHGRFVCFLGPSGCGKTTLLRLIAGLESPTRGHILLDGKRITGTPAHKRNFGMVFQSLALFPHLSVGENVTYSLRVRHIKKKHTTKTSCRTAGSGTIIRFCGSTYLTAIRRPAPAGRHCPRPGHRPATFSAG